MSRRVRWLSTALSSLLLSACATTGAAVAPAPPPDAGVAAPTEAELRARAKALFEREAPPGPTRRVTLGGVELEVESATEVVPARGEGLTSFELGLGTEATVTCHLHDQAYDTGGTLTKVLEGWKKTGVQFGPLRPFSVEVIEKTPALFLDVGYVAQVDGKPARGEVKLLYYPSQTAPLSCLHDEPGYAASFHRVAAGVAAALGRARPPRPAAWRAVSVMSTRGTPVGFVVMQWLKRPDGGFTTVESSTLVVPRSATEWLTVDEVLVGTGARDGSLTEKQVVAVSSGEVERELTLSRVRRGTYRYRGTSHGKPVEGELRTADGKDLLDEAAQARQLRDQLLSGKRAQLTVQDYLPGANPVALTTAKMTRGAGPGEVAVEAGPVQLQLTVDARGLVEKVVMGLGPGTLEQTRVWSEGAP